MDDWRRATILNWRWWLMLPLVPLIVASILLQWAFRAALFALDNTEQVSRQLFNWVRKGATP